MRVIESTTDITTGSQTQSYIRDELSVATPIFMSTFHILFYGRPEIVGKLRTFYHYPDFRIKTAHTICCADNIIFGNRCTEYTSFTKFLLHSFGYIEHAPFIPIGNILPPDEGIRIMAKLRFQRFIDGSYKEFLLSFCLTMCSIFIFFRFVRFRQYIVENGFRIGIGSCQRLTIGSSQVFLCFLFYFFQLFFGETLVTQQHPAELQQRISLFHISQFIFIPVQSIFVRVGMGTDTDTIGMYDYRIPVQQCILTSLSHGIHGVEHIFSITMDNLQILESREVIRHFTGCRLVFLRNRYTISIILPYKNNGQAFKAGTIDSFVDKALG